MLVCGRCDGELVIAAALELGPDGSSDEVNFQLFRCNKCSFIGAGAYEESRRGSGEAWRHRAHEIARADFERIAADLARCPAPDDHHCACEIHRRYAVETDGSRDPLRGVPTIGESFSIASR